jgi:NADP-dependent 3-hydroxy acid dehydrogenase YdfG
MKNILIVGGTGMLAGVTKWLNNAGNRTTVIARNSEKLEYVRSLCKYPENYRAISLNYEDEENLSQSILNEQRIYGTFDMVIAWIHQTAPKTLRLIISEINTKKKSELIVFHVLGSSSNLREIMKETNISQECDYHQVQLGFVIENGESRWLTNDEISNGVIHAIIHQEPVTIVGTLEPWSMRP